MASTMMISDDATARKSTTIQETSSNTISVLNSNSHVPSVSDDRPIGDFKQDDVQLRGPDDVEDGSRDATSGKRKYLDREPESPGQDECGDIAPPYAKKERNYYDEPVVDSPASYPKHVIVPADDRQKGHLYGSHDDQSSQFEPTRPPPAFTAPPDKSGHMLTPDSAGPRQSHGYNDPSIYPRHQPYHDVYRAPSYNPEMDYGRSSYGGHPNAGSNGSTAGSDVYSRAPRRWACDYCNVATFLSYEEACAHEEQCARRHHDSNPYHEHHLPPQPPRPPSYNSRPPPPPPPHHSQPSGSGLGALYHASQEVVTPPTPHHQQANQWGSRGPPLPVLPHEQSYYNRHGYYDRREETGSYHHHEAYYAPPQQSQAHYSPHSSHHSQHSQSYNPHQKRMLLAMASDKDSLSDRQCYVRSEMVEIFAAADKDVSARHSKGAQKLVLGQVGIRCVHCSHLRPRDRAERAVCYPSSISRIYQTVADMQRFHFEQCREIPNHVRELYKKLKTTRPRGVGSPQTYWVSSAKSMGLVDTEQGIRFDVDLAKDQYRQNSDMSVSTP